MKLRKEIRQFAQAMEKVMQKHSKKRDWKRISITCLESKRIEAGQEYNWNKDVKGLIDEANILMMLWHRRNAKEEV